MKIYFIKARDMIIDNVGILISFGLGFFLLYAIVGTSGNVEEIKRLAPHGISERNWEILRYEGYQYGSFGRHGGKVWYHVKDLTIPDTYYRVYVTLWGGELHYVYGAPEKLSRINLNSSSITIGSN